MKSLFPVRFVFALLCWGLVGSVQSQLFFTYDFDNLDRTIPDNNASGVSDARDISTGVAGLLVTGVQVNLDLGGSGTRNGDYYVTLQHGDGFSVLLNRVGRRDGDALGYGDPGLNLTFADRAVNGDVHVYRNTLFGNHDTPLGTSLTGPWAPDGRLIDPDSVLDSHARLGSLSSLYGLPADGSWRLFVADLAGAGVGVLRRWGLEISGVTDNVTPLELSEATVRAESSPRRVLNPVTISGDVALGGGQALTFEGATTVTGNRSVNVQGTVMFAGGLQGSGAGRGLIKKGSGTLVISGTSSFSGPTTVNEGILRVQGDFSSSAVTVNRGGWLAGPGSVGGLVLNSGSTLSPGDSPGSLRSGATTWGGGGTYVWEINAAGGSRGVNPGWDLLEVTGSLLLTATPANPFHVKVVGLTDSGTPGPVSGFDKRTAYTWTIASASGGIVGFDRAALNLDVSGFADHNPLGGGSFDILPVGNNLDVTFTPVPEPAICGLISALGLAVFALVRRRSSAFTRSGNGEGPTPSA